MDIHDASRIITSTLQSQRRTPAFKEGYIDGLTGAAFYGGYTGTTRTQYINGFDKGQAEKWAWWEKKRKPTT